MVVAIRLLPHLDALEGDVIEAVEGDALRETEVGSAAIRGPTKSPGRAFLRVWEEV